MPGGCSSQWQLHAAAMSATRTMKVMVAIDESDCSRYALDWVLTSLRPSLSPLSPLIIFSVQPIEGIRFLPAASLGTVPTELVHSIQQQQKKASLALLETAKKICEDKGVSTLTATEAGDPKEEICKAVDRLNIDLLILGSHGRGVIQSCKTCNDIDGSNEFIYIKAAVKSANIVSEWLTSPLASKVEAYEEMATGWWGMSYAYPQPDPWLSIQTCGRSNPCRTFLGSVSSYCMHNAKCPILVIKRNC